MSVSGTAVHQLVHTLSYGDAISGEVLALQRCFRALGAESEIYALNVHPAYKKIARNAASFPAHFKGRALLHYSLGSPLNDLYRGLNGARRAMIYHNLTPPRWFHGVNPRIVSDLEHGVRELPELCRVTETLIADSSFNAGELKALGFNALVLNLAIDEEKWKVESNSGIGTLLRSNPGIHLLHVGRLAPNKCVEDIIKVFYFLHRYVQEQSKLWLVGIDIDTELYSFALKRLVHELDLQSAVQFVGGRADSELKAFYEASTAYLCMSEHEGFCLPLVEAMYFGLPTFAFASSAVPDTMGSGGVLLKEKRHAEIAELIGRVSTDAALRESLVRAGKERAAQLTLEQFNARVAEIF
jgi:L-malate glycosyltransferase